MTAWLQLVFNSYSLPIPAACQCLALHMSDLLYGRREVAVW